MISVILNVFKRPETLEEQINCILSQSIKIEPKNIHIWYNKSDFSPVYPKIPEIKTYIANWNTKFWGRFSIALLCDTEYVAIFDDDVFPNKDWFKNCLDTINNPNTNGILGGSGIILPPKHYKNHIKVGWNGLHADRTIEVDLVGHSWFFRKDWAKYLWYEPPYTWDNGEDIMFSYLAQKYGGIKTFVPPHPENNLQLWSADYEKSMKVGSDNNASFRKNKKHIFQRDMCVEYCKEHGWKIINKDCENKEKNQYLEELSKIKKDHIISCNIATFPERIDMLKKSVESILPHADVLRIYLNNYESIPDFLKHPKIKTVIGKDDLKALGKLYFMPKENTKEYYFSCDDDFIYDASFFINSIKYLKNNPQHVVGIHGIIINHKTNNTFRESYVEMLNGICDNLEDRDVNVIGSGLICFDCEKIIIPINKEVFPENIIIDLCLSKYFLEKNIKMIVRKHQSNEIISLFDNGIRGYRLCSDKELNKIKTLFLNNNQKLFNEKYEELKNKDIYNSIFNGEEVHVCVATIPIRIKTLEKTVKSILCQLPKNGRLHVCLNGYDSIPDFLLDDKIDIVRSQDVGDRGASNKFYWLGKVKGYYLTIDDDICYDKNYIAYMVSKINEYNKKNVISLHGYDFSLFKSKNFQKDRRKVRPCFADVDGDYYVENIGTGVAGFHTDLIKDITCDYFNIPNRVDPVFSAYCNNMKIPLMVVKHAKGFVEDLLGEKEPSIWKSTTKKTGDKMDTSEETKIFIAQQHWVRPLNEDEKRKNSNEGLGKTKYKINYYKKNNLSVGLEINRDLKLMPTVIGDDLLYLFKKYNIKTILDAPCGEFSWMNGVNLTGIDYLGFDNDENIINENIKKYKKIDFKTNSYIDFYTKDIIFEYLPAADLIICRDFFQQLSIEDILLSLKNFKKSNSKYLMVTNVSSINTNKELIFGFNRAINLMLPPFNLPQPLFKINMGYVNKLGKRVDKEFVLWRLADVLFKK